ncbi:alanine racemase [Candidatus Sumerlaeota bacterium]|nr:alanine racemase [Candidatus Sumerlaeota bacterium]
MSDGTKLLPQTWVEIDLASLRRNFARVAERFDPAVKIILSAKKDAYGHGLIEVARALEFEPRLEALGIAVVEEGLSVRAAGIKTPILCFSVLRGAALAEAIAHDIQLTITDADDAAEASRTAAALGREAVAHLKIDTGMGRLGHSPEETLGGMESIKGLPHLRLSAVYTHLADGWNDPAGAGKQLDRLRRFQESAGLSSIPIHLGGSDVLSMARDMNLENAGAAVPAASLGGRRPPPTLIRSGIAIYGAHPAIPDLEPVMTFKSRVIYRRRAPKGTKISYGGTHTLARDSELAIVGAGYGNGYPRLLSNRAQILIAARRCPVLGRVCMDQIVVDVTDLPEAAVGDEAVLFGRQGNALLPAAEVAQWAETIPYELFCLAGQINPRIAVGKLCQRP